jgi:hypothetical protein
LEVAPEQFLIDEFALRQVSRQGQKNFAMPPFSLLVL